MNAAPPLTWTLIQATTLAHQRLRKHCQFVHHQDAIQVAVEGDRLVLRGRVPSFYLKQVLQTIMRDLPGIAAIDNQVDVVACDGLSSEPRAAVPRRPASPPVSPQDKM